MPRCHLYKPFPYGIYRLIFGERHIALLPRAFVRGQMRLPCDRHPDHLLCCIALHDFRPRCIHLRRDPDHHLQQDKVAVQVRQDRHRYHLCSDRNHLRIPGSQGRSVPRSRHDHCRFLHGSPGRLLQPKVLASRPCEVLQDESRNESRLRLLRRHDISVFILLSNS